MQYLWVLLTSMTILFHSRKILPWQWTSVPPLPVGRSWTVRSGMTTRHRQPQFLDHVMLPLPQLMMHTHRTTLGIAAPQRPVSAHAHRSLPPWPYPQLLLPCRTTHGTAVARRSVITFPRRPLPQRPCSLLHSPPGFIVWFVRRVPIVPLTVTIVRTIAYPTVPVRHPLWRCPHHRLRPLCLALNPPHTILDRQLCLVFSVCSSVARLHRNRLCRPRTRAIPSLPTLPIRVTIIRSIARRPACLPRWVSFHPHRASSLTILLHYQ